jgi:hypothetical protein
MDRDLGAAGEEAQEPPNPAFFNLRYDEVWSSLRSGPPPTGSSEEPPHEPGRGRRSSVPDPGRAAIESETYCFSYTTVELTALPSAFVPLWVMVRVFPSGDTTAFVVMVTLPPFFQVFS